MIPKYASGVSMSNGELSSIYSLAGDVGANALEGKQEPYTLQDSNLNQGRMIGSSAAKYAGQGAAIGSAIPGVGTAVGAGIGAVAGTVMGAVNYNKQNKLYGEWKTNKLKSIEQQGINNYSTNIMMGFKPQGNRYTTFAKGGKLPKYGDGVVIKKDPRNNNTQQDNTTKPKIRTLPVTHSNDESILDVLDIPQKKMIKVIEKSFGFEGREEKPSEAMQRLRNLGYNKALSSNNPILDKTLEVAADLVIDPLNALIPLKYLKAAKGITEAERIANAAAVAKANTTRKVINKTLKTSKNIDNFDDLSETFKTGGKLPRYATGGFTPEYEVEKNEVIQGNNVKLSDGGQVSNDMHLAEGVTHDEINPTTGTTGTLGAGGDRVFSNRSTLLPETKKMLETLKIPIKNNDTHAKVALIVANKEAKFENSVHAVSLRERNSAKQMLQRYATVKDIIFQDQEIQKPQQQEMPQYKFGGVINKFAKGGRTTTINDNGEFVDNSLKEVNFNESKTNSKFDSLEDNNAPTVSTTKVLELQPNLIKPTVVTPKTATTNKETKPIINNPITVKKNNSTIINKPIINTQSPFKNSSDSTEVMQRQDSDYKRYHNFTKRGKDVLNRTDVNRNKDSENYIADNIMAGDVVIDLGSGLGNTNSKLAGVSVNELYQNKKIKNNAAKIIATDIPSEIKSWEQNKNRYNIDYTTVSDTTFKTDINSILKSKGIEKSNHIILRSANSLDLLMNNNQTLEHLNHIATTMKDKKVTYIFNNKVMTKNAGDTKFEITADLNNKAFDHNAPAWKKNDGKPSYTKRNNSYVKFAMGGKINKKLPKYRYAGEIDPPVEIADWTSNNPLLANSITDGNYNNGIKIVRPNVVSQNNNNNYITNPNYKEPINNYSPIVKETMTPIEIAPPKNRLNIPTAPNMTNTKLPYNNDKQSAKLMGGNSNNNSSNDNWGTIANTLNLANNLISVNKLKTFTNPEMPIAPVMRYNSNLPYNIYENTKAGRTALKNMNRYGANSNNKYAVTSSVIEGNNKVFAEDNMRRSDFNNQVSTVKNQIDNQKVQINNAVNQAKVDLNNTKVTERNNAVNVWATGEMQNKYTADQVKLGRERMKLEYLGRYGGVGNRLFRNETDDRLKELANTSTDETMISEINKELEYRKTDSYKKRKEEDTKKETKS